MSIVSKRVSFSVVIALLVGWGVVGFLTIQANQQLLNAESDPLAGTRYLPKGVKFDLEIDKQVYAAGEPVLISLRNDSHLVIHLAKNADTCVSSWWQVEKLHDESDWQPIAITKVDCSGTPVEIIDFPRHTIQTDQWSGFVSASKLGDVVNPVGTGTYRITVPYLIGSQGDTAWANKKEISSSAFTVQ